MSIIIIIIIIIIILIIFCEQAFCEEGNIDDNGILAFAKFVIFSVLELRHQTGKLTYRFMFQMACGCTMQ